MQRIDSKHSINHAPHIISVSDADILRMLCRQVENDEIGCREAGEQLRRFRFITDRIVGEVQDRMPRRGLRIDDPSHAAVMLGAQRLVAVVNEFVQERATAEPS